MKCAIRTVTAGVLWLAAACYGYGGFEVTAGFVDFRGLNHRLDSLNHTPFSDSGVGGSRDFAYRGPLWWFGGHGGGQVGAVTLGGSGAFTIRSNYADSLGCELAALRADFEAGYPYSPVSWFWLRPCLGITGTGFAAYAHSVEFGYDLGNFRARYKRWFSAWGVGVTPGLELMGALPIGSGSYIGLFLKPSYLIRLAGPAWFGDKPAPNFSLSGFSIQLGLRFGRAFHATEEEEEED